MRKLVVLSFISLDGVMQAPGGPDEDRSGGFAYGGWTAPFMDETSVEFMVKQMSMPFDVLLGRKTYDIFASYWPHQSNDWPIAKSLNEAKKYVVSHEQIDLPWEKSELVTGDVAARIRDIKAGDGPMLQVHGSGNMIQTLLQHDLVDELWLKTFPVTLGSGKRLFEAGTMPASFKLLESSVTPSGVIFASYARNGEVRTGTVGD